MHTASYSVHMAYYYFTFSKNLFKLFILVPLYFVRIIDSFGNLFNFLFFNFIRSFPFLVI